MKKNNQLSLNLEHTSQPPEPASAETDEIYFAVLPDAPAASQATDLAGELRRRPGYSGKVRRPDLLHITLCSIGSFPRAHGKPNEPAFAAMEAAASIVMPPFRVAFDRVASFGGGNDRPLVLRCSQGNTELTALRQELLAGMNAIGFSPRRETFAPHMTILRRRDAVEEMLLDTPITWMVRDFVLILSLQGLSKHGYLGYWPLLGSDRSTGRRGHGSFPDASAATASSTL